MRKFLTIVFLMLMAALVYFGYAHYSGGMYPTFGLPLGGEKSRCRKEVTLFFENVRFKNNKALKDFVAPHTETEEITNFLSYILQSPLNQVDLQRVAVTDVELDSSQQRARAHVKLIGKNLHDQKPFDITKIIFLDREPNDKNSRWLIDIKNFFL